MTPSNLRRNIQIGVLLTISGAALGVLIGFAAGRHTALADLASVPAAAVQVDTLDRLADGIIKYEGHESGGLLCVGQPGEVCFQGYVVGANAGWLLLRDLKIKYLRWVRDDLMRVWCHPGPCAYRDALVRELK